MAIAKSRFTFFVILLSLGFALLVPCWTEAHVAKKGNKQTNTSSSGTLTTTQLANAILSADSSVLALREEQEHLAELQLIGIACIFFLGAAFVITISFFEQYIP